MAAIKTKQVDKCVKDTIAACAAAVCKMASAHKPAKKTKSKTKKPAKKTGKKPKKSLGKAKKAKKSKK